MNLCRSCSQDFASVAAFDRHRVGVHAYTFAQGLRMEPAREDGRRCLGWDEFEEAGLALDVRGRYRLEADATRVREHFRGASEGPQIAPAKRTAGTGGRAWAKRMGREVKAVEEDEQ